MSSLLQRSLDFFFLQCMGKAMGGFQVGECVIRAVFLVCQLLSFVGWKLSGGLTYRYLHNLVECEFNYNNILH